MHLRRFQQIKRFLSICSSYDQKAFDRFVKGTPDKYCSPEAARDLAMAAYQRGITFDTDPDLVIGIGATCSLMKNEQERSGREHHIYVGVQTRTATRTLWYKIDGNFANRQEEEKFTSLVIIDTLYQAVTGQSALGEISGFGPKVTQLLKTNEVAEDGNAGGRWALAPLLDERQKTFVEFGSDVTNAIREKVGLPRIILPGSFNPLHQGHIDMARTGHKIYGTPVDLEICVHNVDKPTLNYGEMAKRIDGLAAYKDEPWMGSTLLTNTPTFTEKAEMFPTAKFLVGFDTLKRIGMEKYYFNRHHMLDSFRRIKNLGCVFLVFHRMKTVGGVVEVTDARDFEALPEELKEISFVQQVVPAPLCSSDIRRQG